MAITQGETLQLGDLDEWLLGQGLALDCQWDKTMRAYVARLRFQDLPVNVTSLVWTHGPSFGAAISRVVGLWERSKSTRGTRSL